MNNPNPQQSPALRRQRRRVCDRANGRIAGSCFFISWKKHDHSESLTLCCDRRSNIEFHYVEYLLLLRLIVLTHLARRNARRITDGRGNVIAGGNNGGKSHISYTPYGSIHRTDSSGPDITKFKFTGQEEDKESGLMYYKARYYDPMVGRFLQADSVVMPQSTFGMNRYMYVEGNPVRYGDRSGHNKNNPMLGAIIGYAVANQFSLSTTQGLALGIYFGKGKQNPGKDIANGAKWVSGGLSRARDTFVQVAGSWMGDNEKTRNERRDPLRSIKQSGLYKGSLIENFIEKGIMGGYKKLTEGYDKAIGKGTNEPNKVWEQILTSGAIACVRSTMITNDLSRCSVQPFMFPNGPEDSGGGTTGNDPSDTTNGGVTCTLKPTECGTAPVGGTPTVPPPVTTP